MVWVDCRPGEPFSHSPITGAKVTLSLDGWSSPSQVHVLGFALNQYLVDLIDTDSLHTIEALTDLTTKKIVEYEATFGCHIVAVCTKHTVALEPWNFFPHVSKATVCL